MVAMKRTFTCPKCGHTKLFYVPLVADRTQAASQGGHSPARLAYIEQTAMAVFKVANSAGTIEAYACQRCGYIEYYLKEMMPVDGKYVLEVQGPRG